MKKSVFFFLLLIMSVSSFSQQTKFSRALTKQDYLQKSKKQKKAGGIMLVGGSALLLTSFLIPKGEPTVSYTTTYLLFFSVVEPVKEYKNDGIKIITGFAGVLSMLGSIPFFIASGKNNRRAMSVSFKNEMAPQIQKNSFVYKYVPSLSLKLNL